jgi:carbon-monoxide dehydrogenase small subunit
MSAHLNVNGEARASRSDPMTPLLDVLREEFYLTGAKPVCREGFCGACSVLIDDVAMPSCLIACGAAEGRRIVTIEGLAPTGELTRLQASFEAFDAVQCGMCFPGIVVALTAALNENPGATRDEIRAALTGNICRCTGYERIIEAALAAVRKISS